MISPLSTKRRQHLHIEYCTGIFSYDQSARRIVAADVPEYQQYMLDVASLQLLQCTDSAVKVVKLWQFRHLKQVFDSIFTLVNPAIRQASRIIYELQNPTG